MSIRLPAGASAKSLSMKSPHCCRLLNPRLKDEALDQGGEMGSCTSFGEMLSLSALRFPLV